MNKIVVQFSKKLFIKKYASKFFSYTMYEWRIYSHILNNIVLHSFFYADTVLCVNIQVKSIPVNVETMLYCERYFASTSFLFVCLFSCMNFLHKSYWQVKFVVCEKHLQRYKMSKKQQEKEQSVQKESDRNTLK